MTASHYPSGYSVSRTVVPLLIIALPIMVMIAWLMYQLKADLDTPAPSVSAPAAEPVSFGDATWPEFRGDPQLRGLAAGNLPDKLTLAWQFRTESDIVAAPIIAAGCAFVSSLDKKLYAVNLETGLEKWRFEANDELYASPVYHDGGLYFGSNSGTFYAVDAETGKARWSFDEASEIAGSANIGTDADGQTIVVFGSYDNYLYALNAADGTLSFKHPAENYINGAVAVADNTAFFGSCDANIYQVPLGDPNAAKTLDTGSYVAANPAIDNGVIYVGNYEGRFLAADIAAQQIVWTHEDTKQAFFSSPAVNDSVVICGCRDKKLYCFDKKTGSVRWTFSAGDNFDSSPVICGDRVVVGNDDGRLYVLDIETGREVFAYTVGSPILGSAAIAQNTLLIGADNGILYAFTAE